MQAEPPSKNKLGSRCIAAGFLALLALTATSPAQFIQDAKSGLTLRVLESVEVDYGDHSIFYNWGQTSPGFMRKEGTLWEPVPTKTYYPSRK